MFIETQSLTAQMFTSEIGQVFIAETVPEPVQLTLLQIVEGKVAATGFRRPFSLIFTTPPQVLLLEAQYRMQSESGREYLLHLSPIVSPADGLRHYQAQFN